MRGRSNSNQNSMQTQCSSALIALLISSSLIFLSLATPRKVHQQYIFTIELSLPAKIMIATSQEGSPAASAYFQQGEMIVDFPSSSSNLSKPRVTFSEYSQLSLIPKADECTQDSTWHTREQQQSFTESTMAQTRRLRNLLADTPPESITQQDLYECVGLENLLSSEISRKVVLRKRAHVDLILSVQRSHHGACYKAEKIAFASMHSSRWSRERAANLAASYATSLNDSTSTR